MLSLRALLFGSGSDLVLVGRGGSMVPSNYVARHHGYYVAYGNIFAGWVDTA